VSRGRAVRDETRRKQAQILRTSPTHIQPDLVLRPQFNIRASQMTRSGLVGIGSYGVFQNERESKLDDLGLYEFPPQSPMES
jgi:hypothetical protein